MPWILPLCLLAVACVAPWGNFPLNDDWQYALLAKRLAETGKFVVDLRIAPSVVAQSYAVRPLVALTGFSHRTLRLATIALAIAMLFIFDGLLKIAGVGRTRRMIAGAVLFFNPLYFTLAQSFMTELWGYVPAFGAALVWFRGRQRAQDAPIGWWTLLVAAGLAGATFWVRQLCALVFPALVVSAVIGTRRGRGRHAVGLALWGVIVAGYFVWARAGGNYNPNFSGPLGHVTRLDFRAWAIETSIAVFTLGAFLFPLLILFRPRFTRARLVAIAFFALGIGLARAHGETAYRVSAWLHRDFPFLGNVIFRGGIGPITLSDVYVEDSPTIPRLPAAAWSLAAAGAAWGAMGWTGVVAALPAGGLALEVATFGAALALGTHLIVVQAFRTEIFDRYLIAAFLGLLLVVTIALERIAPSRLRLGVAAVGWLAIAWFSVAGVHDYFRWNERRAELLAVADEEGEVDAGYEINGWLYHTSERARHGADCVAEDAWFHCAKRYRIALDVVPGYLVAQTRPVAAWLTPFPDMKLLVRRPASRNATPDAIHPPPPAPARR